MRPRGPRRRRWPTWLGGAGGKGRGEGQLGAWSPSSGSPGAPRRPRILPPAPHARARGPGPCALGSSRSVAKPSSSRRSPTRCLKTPTPGSKRAQLRGGDAPPSPLPAPARPQPPQLGPHRLTHRHCHRATLPGTRQVGRGFPKPHSAPRLPSGLGPTLSTRWGLPPSILHPSSSILHLHPLPLPSPSTHLPSLGPWFQP